MKNTPFISVGKNELVGNRKLTSGETILCHICGADCTIRTHNLERSGDTASNGTVETIKCLICNKTYLVGVDGVYLWEHRNEVS